MWKYQKFDFDKISNKIWINFISKKHINKYFKNLIKICKKINNLI